ncbi:hypothetical protein [Streptomyces syringium]|uniref:hypothetical protein n=1 Tax=Streptomyces syringium TaxID=76729 RepID=UPI0033F2174B
MVGTAVVQSNGWWYVTPGSDLPYAQVTLTATQATAGGTSPQATRTFTIRMPVPGAPAFHTPAAGILVGQRRPAVNGTGVVGATVRVYYGAGLVGTAVVQSSGWWYVTPGFDLPYGQVTLTATQANGGGTSPQATRTFTIAQPQASVGGSPLSALPGATNVNPTVEVRNTGQYRIDAVPVTVTAPSGMTFMNNQLVLTRAGAADPPLAGSLTNADSTLTVNAVPLNLDPQTQVDVSVSMQVDANAAPGPEPVRFDLGTPPFATGDVTVDIT